MGVEEAHKENICPLTGLLAGQQGKGKGAAKKFVGENGREESNGSMTEKRMPLMDHYTRAPSALFDAQQLAELEAEVDQVEVELIEC
jgi:hypothetical protein